MVVNTQHSTGCLVVCFPGMTLSLAKSKQIIGCALSDAYFLKFSYFYVPQYSNRFAYITDRRRAIYFNNQKTRAQQ